MPELPDRRIPATAFPLFNNLPEEIRLQIWIEALPGPRIIKMNQLIQMRGARSIPWDGRDININAPLASCFTPLSPNNPIIFLLHACRESRSVVEERYSLLLPESSTWFSVSNDFLYLEPEDFEYSIPPERLEVSEGVARQVRNLVVYHDYSPSAYLEEWLARDVFRLFTGAKVLVMADQLHNPNESSQELVWLAGGVENRLKSDQDVKEEEEYWLFLRSLILWMEFQQPRFCPDVDQQQLERIWRRFTKGKGYEMPKIARGSITTANLKRRLLEICHSKDNLWRLKGLDWDFIRGEKEYAGNLDYTQQIAFLELAIERIPNNGDRGEYIQSGEYHLQEILCLLSKIEFLEAERERLELLICDAEEMG